jgi:capsule polysaccharide export protein KpsE/RkpR
MNGMFDALEFVEYVRKRWLTIAIACGVAVTVVLTVSLTLPKRYTSTASILIQAPAGNDPRAATAVSPVYLESLKSFETLASSDTLFAQALAALQVREGSGGSFSSLKKQVLKITKPSNTAIIEIAATLRDPRKAQGVAQFIAEHTVKLSRSLDERTSNDLETAFQSQLNSAVLRYTKAREALAAFAASQPMAELENDVREGTELTLGLDRDLQAARMDLAEYAAQGSSPNQIPSTKARIASIESQLRTLREGLTEKNLQLDQRKFRRAVLENEEHSAQTAWEAANTRMNEMLTSAEFRGERLQILDPGTIPDQPSSPNTSLNIAAALLLSLAASILWLIIRFSHSRLVEAREAQSYRVRALR